MNQENQTNTAPNVGLANRLLEYANDHVMVGEPFGISWAAMSLARWSFLDSQSESQLVFEGTCYGFARKRTPA